MARRSDILFERRSLVGHFRVEGTPSREMGRHTRWGRMTIGGDGHCSRSAHQKTRNFALLVVALSISTAAVALASSRMLGAFGPEGTRMREQLWLVPSGDPAIQLRATVFRPHDERPQRRKLVVINHGTDDSTLLSVSLPVYYWLSRWFVERGYVVVIPQRRGHGATGGELIESVGTCETADHYTSGQIAADDIAATIDFMIQQNFVASQDVVVVGISTGGWASLALASRNLPSVGSIVNFAGGRGGHAYGQANAICNLDGLLRASYLYGKAARHPSIWLYSTNDSYFAPEIALALAHQWKVAGGIVESHILPALNKDGHAIADDRAGWSIWGDALEAFLGRHRTNLETETASRNEIPDAASAERAR
jgi:dienelactone hydrolase